jgi:hypothetical protein
MSQKIKETHGTIKNPYVSPGASRSVDARALRDMLLFILLLMFAARSSWARAGTFRIRHIFTLGN